MKKIAAAILILLLLSSCAWTDPGAGEKLCTPEQSLTVCIPESEELWKPFVREFQQRTGIWVRIRTDIRDESNDVLLDYDPLEDGIRLSKSVCVGQQVPVIVSNPHLIRKNAPGGLLNLLEAPWRDTLAFADPASSRFSRSFLALLGELTPDASAGEVISAFSRAVSTCFGSSREVLEAVGSGTATLGLVPESQALLALEEGIRLDLIAPEEGSFLFPILAGICRNAPNPENAEAFLAFLLEEDTQNHLKTFCRVRPAAETPTDISFYAEAASMRRLLRLWNETWEVKP